MSPVISPSQQPNRLYLGTQVIDRAYMGSVKVWEGWTPKSVSGLKIWLDASQLALADGAAVSPWPNLAVGGAVGTMVGTPVPKISTNKLKGQRLVRFTVSEGRLRITGSGCNLDFTLAYISRMLGNAGRIVCAAYPDPNFLIGWWNGFMDVGYSSTGAFFLPDGRKAWDSEGTPSPWILYSGDSQASPWAPRMFRNGVLMSTGGPGTPGINDGWGVSGTFNISGYHSADSTETCDCEIAEVILYNRKISDSDRQAVENYLRNKWLT
jgi:hypothetical protein